MLTLNFLAGIACLAFPIQDTAPKAVELEVARKAIVGWIENQEAIRFYDCRHRLKMGTTKFKELEKAIQDTATAVSTKERRVVDGVRMAHLRVRDVEPAPAIPKPTDKEGYLATSVVLPTQTILANGPYAINAGGGANISGPGCTRPDTCCVLPDETGLLKKLLEKWDSIKSDLSAERVSLPEYKAIALTRRSKNAKGKPIEFVYHFREDWGWMPVFGTHKIVDSNHIQAIARVFEATSHDGRWFPKKCASLYLQEKGVNFITVIEVDSVTFDRKGFEKPLLKMPAGEIIDLVCGGKEGRIRLKKDETYDWDQL